MVDEVQFGFPPGLEPVGRFINQNPKEQQVKHPGILGKAIKSHFKLPKSKGITSPKQKAHINHKIKFY